jgi:TusA-related sulfurtransferase
MNKILLNKNFHQKNTNNRIKIIIDHINIKENNVETIINQNTTKNTEENEEEVKDYESMNEKTFSLLNFIGIVK